MGLWQDPDRIIFTHPQDAGAQPSRKESPDERAQITHQPSQTTPEVDPYLTLGRIRETLLKRARAHARLAQHFRAAAKDLPLSKRLIGEKH
jgi:hypothetical protein